MYHPSRVAQRIELAQREFSVTLEPHSIADVDSFEDHLKRYNKYELDQNGAPKGMQHLTQFEHDWILNEQLLVSCDAMYALTRSLVRFDSAPASPARTSRTSSSRISSSVAMT